MKKTFICSGLLAIVLCGCKNYSLDMPAESSVDVGLNSFITLEAGKNIIYTKDYILEPEKVDSVTIDNKMLITRLSETKDSIIVIAGKLKPLQNLAIWVEGVPYSILCKRNDEVDFTFRYNPGDKRWKRVQLAGQMNDWVPSQHPDLTLNSDSLYEVTFRISPGTYLYQLVRDGDWNHDETNPEKVDNGFGKFNSIMHIKGTQDKAPVLLTSSSNGKEFTLNTFNSVEQIYAYWQNYKLPGRFIESKDSTLTVKVPNEADVVQRSYIRVITSNKYGISNDILIPLEYGNIVTDAKQITRDDKHSQVLYSLLVDRFYNGNRENDHPMRTEYPDINPKVDYYGGDIAGITEKIKDGYFDSLGISTIWMSPINQNPLKPYSGITEPVKTRFTGYHGYWPISSSKIDFRFGTSDEMKALVSEAHAHGINVILDYVANHVHEEHPMFKNDPTICTPLILPDGTKNLERWNDQRLTTWFDEFLPTLDYSREEIVQTMTDSAVAWVTTYDLDGFRHDACKHVQEHFWQTLTYKLKKVGLEKNKNIYQIGESYGSPKLISSYVNSGMLNGQFDFNVSDDAANVFAVKGQSLTRISNTLNMSLKVYGSHNLMGYISGNHDRARFASIASGDVPNKDDKISGWIKDITVSDSTAYDKVVQLNVFNLTIPGVPVIYYGDEIGDAGANDPDCRRMMRFGEQLSANEKSALNRISTVAKLRHKNMALMYGDFIELRLDDNTWAYARNYFGSIAIVVFNKSDEAKEIGVLLPKIMEGKNYKANLGSEFTLEGNLLKVTVPANGVEVLTQE